MNIPQKERRFAVVSKTDTGKRRDNNEDSTASLIINFKSFNTNFNCVILVVADGMGGHEMGEVASDIATKCFIEEVVQNILKAIKLNGELNIPHILTRSIKVVNIQVCELSKGKVKPACTTLVGAIIIKNYVYIVNVGDSRAYFIKPQETITQITKDHTVVQEMLDSDLITKEKAKNHPRRNNITKALGLAAKVVPDIYEEKMEDRTLLLCSDGLYNMLDENEITKTITHDLYRSAENLTYLANEHGGLDNISIVLAGKR